MGGERRKSATVSAADSGLEKIKRVLLLIISLAVKLASRGPVFVRETKYDMTIGRSKSLNGSGKRAFDESNPKTGIGELPQFFDVFRRQMCIL